MNIGLEHKGYKSFNEVNCLKRQCYDWISSEDQTTRNNQLKNSFKTLATFSRVINALVEKNKLKEAAQALNETTQATATTSSKKNSGGVSSSSSSTATVHVPFRDCPLTRLLKPSLEGNCFLSMITLPPSNNIDSASRALRFASQIGKLFNMIWINEQIQTIKRSSANKPNGMEDQHGFSSNASVTDHPRNGLSQTIEDKQQQQRQDNPRDAADSNSSIKAFQANLQEDVVKFQSSVDQVQNEMNLLVNDLNYLEHLHEEMLNSLSRLHIKPVKQYQDSIAFMNYQIAEKLVMTSIADTHTIDKEKETKVFGMNELNAQVIEADENSSNGLDNESSTNIGNDDHTETTTPSFSSNFNGNFGNSRSDRNAVSYQYEASSKKTTLSNRSMTSNSSSNIGNQKIANSKTTLNNPNQKLDAIPRAISQQGIRSITATVTSSSGAQVRMANMIGTGTPGRNGKQLTSLDDTSSNAGISMSTSSRSMKAQATTLASPSKSSSSIISALPKPPLASLKTSPSRSVDQLDNTLSTQSPLKPLSSMSSPLSPAISPQGKPVGTPNNYNGSVGQSSRSSLRPVVSPMKADSNNISSSSKSKSVSSSLGITTLSPRAVTATTTTSSTTQGLLSPPVLVPLPPMDKSASKSLYQQLSLLDNAESIEGQHTYQGENRYDQFVDSFSFEQEYHRQSEVVSPLDDDEEVLSSPSSSARQHSVTTNASSSTLNGSGSVSSLPRISPSKTQISNTTSMKVQCGHIQFQQNKSRD